jgi:hypothetical protein
VSRWGRARGAWQRGRKPIIAGFTALHFGFGLLCFVESPSFLAEIPGVEEVTYLYDQAGFPQTWRMFSPPSQCIYEIGYSLKFSEGWTPLMSFDDILREQTEGRWFLPQGYIRLANHFRHPQFKHKHLAEEPFHHYYFQQLAAFFLFGDGRIDGIEAIRFYSIVKGVPPFFETDEEGHSMPKAEDFDKVEPLYERSINDR